MTAITEAEMVGRRFGKLVVLGLAERKGTRGARFWLCRCDCGREKPVHGTNLRDGNSKACGLCRTPTFGALKHGHSTKTVKTPTYRSWKGMKARCHDSSREGARYYIGRGISYDPRWEDFEAFLADMGERPAGRSLDRRNNDQGYSKENCRWATPTEQTRNRRIAKTFTYDGRTMPIAEWAKERGISYGAAFGRIKDHGALEFPSHNRRGRRSVKTFTHEGRTLYISEWAKEYGISYNVAQMRIKRHGSLELQP